jgi:hypothetical protein
VRGVGSRHSGPISSKECVSCGGKIGELGRWTTVRTDRLMARECAALYGAKRREAVPEGMVLRVNMAGASGVYVVADFLYRLLI